MVCFSVFRQFKGCRHAVLIACVGLLSACQEAAVGAVGAVYYYSSVPEGPTPPESVFVKPAWQTVEVEAVRDARTPHKNVSNAYRGEPMYYRPVAPPPEDQAMAHQQLMGDAGMIAATQNGVAVETPANAGMAGQQASSGQSGHAKAPGDTGSNPAAVQSADTFVMSDVAQGAPRSGGAETGSDPGDPSPGAEERSGPRWLNLMVDDVRSLWQ